MSSNLNSYYKGSYVLDNKSVTESTKRYEFRTKLIQKMSELYPKMHANVKMVLATAFSDKLFLDIEYPHTLTNQLRKIEKIILDSD